MALVFAAFGVVVTLQWTNSDTHHIQAAQTSTISTAAPLESTTGDATSETASHQPEMQPAAQPQLPPAEPKPNQIAAARAQPSQVKPPVPAIIGIDKELKPAIEQLRGVFGFTGFELLEAVSLSMQSGRGGTVEGGIQGIRNAIFDLEYRIFVRQLRLVPAEDSPDGWMIRLDGLMFSLEGTVHKATGDGDTGRLVHMETEIVIREGQKAIIGRSTPRGIQENLVLILEAEIQSE